MSIKCAGLECVGYHVYIAPDDPVGYKILANSEEEAAARYKRIASFGMHSSLISPARKSRLAKILRTKILNIKRVCCTEEL